MAENKKPHQGWVRLEVESGFSPLPYAGITQVRF